MSIQLRKFEIEALVATAVKHLLAIVEKKKEALRAAFQPSKNIQSALNNIDQISVLNVQIDELKEKVQKLTSKVTETIEEEGISATFRWHCFRDITGEEEANREKEKLINAILDKNLPQINPSDIERSLTVRTISGVPDVDAWLEDITKEVCGE